MCERENKEMRVAVSSKLVSNNGCDSAGLVIKCEIFLGFGMKSSWDEVVWCGVVWGGVGRFYSIINNINN